MRESRAAQIFSALGDETRLKIVRRLTRSPHSINQLTAETDLTRQAVTKHLRVLEDAGLVASSREGRATVYQFRAKALDESQEFLAAVSAQWDNALARLKDFVE